MKKSSTKKKYAAGTGEQGVSGGGGFMQFAQMIPGLADGIMDLIDNNPNNYSKQPTLNASTMRNMVDPYKFAFGGEMDDDTMEQLQAMADEQGITVEELIQMLQEQQSGGADESEEDMMDIEDGEEQGETEFAYGGVLNDLLLDGGKKRKKNNTPVASPFGIYSGIVNEDGTPNENPTVDQSIINMAKYMMNNNSPLTTKPSNVYREEFQHHSTVDDIKPLTIAAYGGKVKNKSIEVEGDEVLETPSGDLAKMVGPSHEKGGIDVNVPEGTKIFSDRIKVDGKTMQERKLARERQTNKLNKLLGTSPTDKIVKNTLARTLEVSKAEEAQDMSLQKIVNKVYTKPQEKFGYGGKVKAAFGEGDPFDGNPMGVLGGLEDYLWGDPGFNPPANPNAPLFDRTGGSPIGTIPANINNPNVPLGRITPNVDASDLSMPQRKGIPNPFKGMTTGDVVGLGGNLWNAIAPIINTRNNAAGNKPNINRYRGFGRKAIESNNAAQTYVGAMKTNALTDIDTAANTSVQRNRNSARGVNTVRALDIATDMGKNKARNGVQDAYSKQMMSLLGQRGQLENLKDKVEMSGETQRDMEDKADRDNFYTNMAANLTNFGTNIQGLGRNLNVAHSNKVDANLISQLSKYGLEYDEDGNLVTSKKK